jgi:hypothetical protein
MAYIVSSVMRKAFNQHENISKENTMDELWKYLMLLPKEYSQAALFNPVTRNLMSKIEFHHGGKEYDD